MPIGHPIREYGEKANDISVCETSVGPQKLIIPGNERKTLLEELHSFHISLEQMKRQARKLWFWPGLDNAIKQMVLQCKKCQVNRKSKEKAPPVPKLHLSTLVPMDSLRCICTLQRPGQCSRTGVTAC